MHAASHADHEKNVAWVSISIHACGSVPIVMVLRLGALRAAGALKTQLSDYDSPYCSVVIVLLSLQGSLDSFSSGTPYRTQ